MTVDQQRHYQRLLRRGFPPGKAVEIATGPFAGFASLAAVTSTRFLAGVADPFAGHGPEEIKLARAKAQKAGVNIDGKKYNTQLAREHWDPAAWYSDPLDLRKKCIASGRSYEGYGGNVPGRSLEEDPWAEPYQVRDSIVEADAQQIIAEEKLDVTPKEKAQLKAQLRDQYSGRTEETPAQRQQRKAELKRQHPKSRIIPCEQV